MLPQLTKLKGMALDFFFPQWCIGCGKVGDLLCPSCYRSLHRILPPLCPRCGRPQPSGVLCPACVSWQASVDGIRSPFRFDGLMRSAIHQLKYKNLRSLALPLAKLLNDYLNNNSVPGEIIVPVPLHPKRLRERGYNQSSLLAKELGKLTTIPIVNNCLARERYASPQARTSTVGERRSNVADAFICRDSRLRNKQVLLLDDVSTSGATLDACAAVLKAAGANSVWGLVLAREI